MYRLISNGRTAHKGTMALSLRYRWGVMESGRVLVGNLLKITQIRIRFFKLQKAFALSAAPHYFFFLSLSFPQNRPFQVYPSFTTSATFYRCLMSTCWIELIWLAEVVKPIPFSCMCFNISLGCLIFQKLLFFGHFS